MIEYPMRISSDNLRHLNVALLIDPEQHSEHQREFSQTTLSYYCDEQEIIK